jgi:hypothetical protein
VQVVHESAQVEVGAAVGEAEPSAANLVSRAILTASSVAVSSVGVAVLMVGRLRRRSDGLCASARALPVYL